MRRPRALLGCALALAASTLDPVAGASGSFASQSSDDSKTAYESQTPRFEVSVTGGVGDERLHLIATRADLSAILRRVGLDTHRELIGHDLLSRDPQVTAKVEGVDLRDGLRWVGGSVGLHITLTTAEIRVVEDLPPYPTREELYERAGTGYLMALIDHPSSALAPGAMWNRARIEESMPSRVLEAARAFDEIVETHPASDLVPKSLLEAGIMYGKAHLWNEAAARFDQLASLGGEQEHGPIARRLLADAYTRLAEEAANPLAREDYARRALYVAEALDDRYPTQKRDERRRRYVVRSRAHSLAGQPIEAMKCIDKAASYSFEGERDPELAELRALAFERADRPADAILAWLFHASLVEGAPKAVSYERAARSANQGAEYLTTITIAKAAEGLGFGDRIAPYADAAWTALDMEPQRLDLFGDAERITRGERLVRKGLQGEAARALRPVFDRRASLAEPDRIRLARSFATALAAENRLDDALTVLRKIASELPLVAQRRDIYILAADLLESAGQLERAIAALEGRL